MILIKGFGIFLIHRDMKVKNMLVSFLLLLSPHLFAASSQFLNVESFIVTPDAVDKILPYAINIASQTEPFNKSLIKYLADIDSPFIYTTKVKVNKVIYYRLVAGNYATLKQARKHLLRIKKYYPEAWLNMRRTKEIKELAWLLSSPADLKKLGKIKLQPAVAAVMIPKVTAKVFSPVTLEVAPKNIPAITPEVTSIEAPKKVAGRSIPEKPLIKKISFAEKLLEQARQLFLDRNYARVIAVSEKVIEIGLPEQKQRAMEFIGIARERQRKFAQAVAIYTQFLELYPDSKLTPRIKIRLTGLKTMGEDPRARLANSKRRKADENWNIYGSLSQYYRNDFVDREE
ncbi:MAG: hypothetical protein KAU21_08600, partial [Gammaproteobacteria bacterium]|nr:hypothetical protein [Gammaproteobacteria bacterium]